MSFSELATMIPKAGSMNEYVRAGLGRSSPRSRSASATSPCSSSRARPRTSSPPSSRPTCSAHPGTTSSGRSSTWRSSPSSTCSESGRSPRSRSPHLHRRRLAPRRRHRRPRRGRGERSDRQRAAGHRPHVEPLGTPRARDLHLRRRRVHLSAGRGAEAAERDIPLGIFLGLGLIAIPVVLYGLAAARYVPPDVLGTLAPTIPVDVGVAIFGDAGKWWMGIIVILASIGTLNAVVAGVPASSTAWPSRGSCRRPSPG